MNRNLKIKIEGVVKTQMDLIWNNNDIIIILPRPMYEEEEIVDWEMPDVSELIGSSIILSQSVILKDILQIITKYNMIGGSSLLDKYFANEGESKIFIIIIIRYDVDDFWHYEIERILEKGYIIFQLDKLTPTGNSEMGELGVRMLEDSLKFKELLNRHLEKS